MKKVIFVFTVLFCFSGCKKNVQPELPPPTQEGKNIFACKVNGKSQIYSGIPTTLNADGVHYFHGVDMIFLSGTSSEYNDEFYLTMHYPPTINVNTDYILGTDSSGYFAERYTGNNSKPFITTGNAGVIRFTRFDMNIASGTFSFTAYRDNESIKITEGRFDIAR